MKEEYELIKKIYRKKEIEKYQKKVIYLDGYLNNSKVISFLNTRLIISICLFMFILLISNFNIIISLIISIMFYYLYTYYEFDYKLKKKEEQEEKDAIYFFEVLILALESGKNLIKSLEITCDNIDNSVSNEFKKSLKEIKYGKSFNDALIDLKKKFVSDILENIIINLIEVYTTGGDIINTLDKELKFIENKRIMNIKSKINKIPIKISVVSVFIFIPLILLIILSPVILKYLASSV